MIFRHACLLLPVLSLSACMSMSIERNRDARLMPHEVAVRILDQHFAPGFSSSPALYPALLNHEFCDDRNAKAVKFSDMEVSWSEREVIITTRGGASFWCGSRLQGLAKLPDKAAVEDVVDALIAMGAKPLIKPK